ncbi:hypothetical protein J4E91_010826 [Alternaria rosae]|nr:hypothetical protein J4E91_010826 [Alternaria rosae]
MTPILFNDDGASRPSTSDHLANPTLANLKDAQDTSITALPQPVVEAEVMEEDGFWKRLWAKIRNALGFGEQEVEYEEEREMCIGGVPQSGDEEGDWEDVE